MTLSYKHSQQILSSIFVCVSVNMFFVMLLFLIFNFIIWGNYCELNSTHFPRFVSQRKRTDMYIQACMHVET